MLNKNEFNIFIYRNPSPSAQGTGIISDAIYSNLKFFRTDIFLYFWEGYH